MSVRLPAVLLLLSAIFAQSSAQSPPSADANPFSYLKCWIDSGKGAFALSSSTSMPNSYTVCFRIQGRNCSDPTSSCCKRSYVATFILDARLAVSNAPFVVVNGRVGYTAFTCIHSDLVLPNSVHGYTYDFSGTSKSTESTLVFDDDAPFSMLPADSTCDGDMRNITASFNGQPLPGLNISRHPAAPANTRLLTIPGLVINATTVGSTGASICITLPGPGRCPFSSLAVGGSSAAWTAALLSSDAKCCPITRGTAPLPSPQSPNRLVTSPPSPQSSTSPVSNSPSGASVPPRSSPPPSPSPPRPPATSPSPLRPPPPPPPAPPRPPPPLPKPPQPRPPSPRSGPCQTCLVWEVLASQGTQTPSSYNFLSNDSCALVDTRPEDKQNGVNSCCDTFAAYQLSYFADLRRQGRILSGFDKPTCESTRVRFCGTLPNETVGRQLAAAWPEDDFLQAFDVTDDTCPMALINSTVRLYSALPGNATLDTSCVPINMQRSNICREPDRTLWEDDYVAHFPADSCDDTPGIMPFAVQPYVEPTYGENVDTFCINIRPMDVTRTSKSPCNNTAIRRMSFWLWDIPELRSELRSVYVMLLRNGTYTKRFITRSWGQEGDKTLTITGLGLDATTIRTMTPKVCFDFNAYMSLWYMTVDPLGYLWSAMYDSSGNCCPTYYSNRY